MTTFAEESIQCGACGRVFTHNAIASTNAFGSPDLDTRPPEMQRSTMPAWVQRCPSCDHCATQVSKFDPLSRPVMDSKQYRAQLTDPDYPNLASTFICAGMLAVAAGQMKEAVWHYVHAAWTLDDAKKDALAHTWRSNAADIALELLRDGHRFIDQPGASEAVLTDCLRRASRPREALQMIESGLAAQPEEIIQKILHFQRSLIERGDTGRHLIEEVATGE
jgi:hypothetical protein